MNSNEFKMILKKNKYVDAITRILAYPLLLDKENKSTREAEKRIKGYKDERYEWIKSLKNKYVGKRCFIVATGPSLTMEDLELIKDEYTFGMNSCILAFDKTKWRPDFYAIQDEYVFDKLEKSIRAQIGSNLKDIWVADFMADKYRLAEPYKAFPLHYLDHKMFHYKGYGKFRFSDDCYSCVYDGYTVTFSILQLACYMGFREIYLLGCDCNYNQPKGHFVEYGHRDPKAAVMGDKMICGHYEFKKFADAHNVKVINCTRGGMLEVYPRMNLEDALR